MADRYFVPTPILGPRAVLSGAEAYHLTQVMRAGAGEEVTLFDGSGAEFPSRVVSARRGQVELEVLARREVDRELSVELTLATALPKGDRQRWLVEKAVELGVARLVPLATTRSVARPGGGTVERLGRQVIEASKQCGRNRLMEIAPPVVWPALVAATEQDALRIVAHTSGGLRLEAILGERRPSEVVIAIGPEGGLTDEEVLMALSAGWRLLDLGPRILRVETAALATVAQIVARS